MDFYTSGDVAPGGRFKFSYISTAENAAVTETETETSAETPVETEPLSETEPVAESETTAEMPVETSAETPAETVADDAAGCKSTVSLSVLLLPIAAGLFLCKRKETD